MLVVQHKYDTGMFLQVAYEYGSDIEANRSVPSDIDFHESRITLSAQPAPAQGDGHVTDYGTKVPA
jgi:hypothetical protein